MKNKPQPAKVGTIPASIILDGRCKVAVGATVILWTNLNTGGHNCFAKYSALVEKINDDGYLFVTLKDRLSSTPKYL